MKPTYYIIKGENDRLTEQNPTFKDGDLVMVDMDEEYPSYKIGDGKTKYNDLPFIKYRYKIGLFFGTFNPVHNGHIELAKEIIGSQYNEIEKIIFVPSFNVFHKDDSEVVSFEDRLNMLRKATENEKNIGFSDIERQLGCENYTYNVLKALEDETGSHNDYYLIMGADNFDEIHKWYKAKDLLKEYPICVLERDDFDISNQYYYLKTNNFRFKGLQILNDIKPFKLSSTFIRKNIKSGEEDVSEALPNGVLDYIKEHKLYGIEGEL